MTGEFLKLHQALCILHYEILFNLGLVECPSFYWVSPTAPWQKQSRNSPCLHVADNSAHTWPWWYRWVGGRSQNASYCHLPPPHYALLRLGEERGFCWSPEGKENHFILLMSSEIVAQLLMWPLWGLGRMRGKRWQYPPTLVTLPCLDSYCCIVWGVSSLVGQLPPGRERI